jgi:PPOX class probable F420-dependent enzyme
MAEFTASQRALFEQSTFAHLATMLPSGAPHVTPVWIDYDEATGHVLVNTERGRQKERNVRRTPHVGASMLAPENPYQHCSFVGEVTACTTDGARDHIDELARRYTGDDYANPIETERVIIRIEPTRVFGTL